ncbi:MAG: hypothetical protein ABEK50_15500, partial [bacterium]
VNRNTDPDETIGTDRRWIREAPAELSNFGHRQLIYEVTRFPYREPNSLQLEASEELYWRSALAMKTNNWFRLKKAKEDGYGSEVVTGDHYIHRANHLDNRMLVPNGIETLMIYDRLDDGHILAGGMYFSDGARKPGPQIGGPITKWHYHIYDTPYCFVSGTLILDQKKPCGRGKPMKRSPEMIHVWILQHVGGSFGTRMDFERRYIEQYPLGFRP